MQSIVKKLSARLLAVMLAATLLLGLLPLGALAADDSSLPEAASISEAADAGDDTGTVPQLEPPAQPDATDGDADTTDASDADMADDPGLAPEDAPDADTADAPAEHTPPTEPEADDSTPAAEDTSEDDAPPDATPALGGPLEPEPAPPAETEAEATLQAESDYLEGASKLLEVLAGAPLRDASYLYYAANPDLMHYYTNAAGQLCVVSARPEAQSFKVFIFDTNLNCVDTKTLPFTGFTEWGGFYKADDGNFYVVVGRRNDSEDNSLTVVEVRKYNANWAHTGTTELKDIDTTLPFRSGNCRMAMADSTLIVRISHQMYTASDGLRHQANATFLIDSTTMAWTGGFWGVMNVGQYAYVSHSFNQFVQVQGNDVLFVDHGDAYPRAVVLARAANIADGFYRTTPTTLLGLQGETGENYTGTTVTGFELGQNGNLVVGGSVPHNNAVGGVTGFVGDLLRNIYLIVTDKTTDAPTFTWLTDYTPTRTDITLGEPRMVKLDEDRFAILFTVTENDTPRMEYRLVNSSGSVLASKSFAGVTFCAGSQPLVYNNTLVWVAGEVGSYGDLSDTRYLYELNMTDAASPVLQARLRAVEPQAKSVYVGFGRTRQLGVAYTPANAVDTALAWASTNPAVASVDANGVVSGHSYGTTTIRATSVTGLVAECTVTVAVSATSIQMHESDVTVVVGNKRTLNTTVQPANADIRTLIWQVDDPAVASVDATGTVTGLAPGSTVVRAVTDDGSFTAECAVTVRLPDVTKVALSQSTLVLWPYVQRTLKATAITSDGSTAPLRWSSSNTKVATVDEKGRLTTHSTGTATIKATAQNGKSASMKVTVVSYYYLSSSVKSVSATVPQTMQVGTQKAITKAKYAPAKVGNTPVGDVQITYKSSKSSVVSVDAAGVLTAKKKGKATITVKAGSATKKYTVQVTAPKATKLTLSETRLALNRKGTRTLKVRFTPANADKTVTWKSSKPSVATVSSKGKVKALKKGKTTITVTATHGKKKAQCVVTVK